MGQRTPSPPDRGLRERCKAVSSPSEVYFLCSHVTSPAIENHFLALFLMSLRSGPSRARGPQFTEPPEPPVSMPLQWNNSFVSHIYNAIAEAPV